MNHNIWECVPFSCVFTLFLQQLDPAHQTLAVGPRVSFYNKCDKIYKIRNRQSYAVIFSCLLVCSERRVRKKRERKENRTTMNHIFYKSPHNFRDDLYLSGKT